MEGGVNSVFSVTACRVLLTGRMALPAVPHNPIERCDHPPNKSNRRPLLDRIVSIGDQDERICSVEHVAVHRLMVFEILQTSVLPQVPPVGLGLK